MKTRGCIFLNFAASGTNTANTAILTGSIEKPVRFPERSLLKSTPQTAVTKTSSIAAVMSAAEAGLMP